MRQNARATRTLRALLLVSTALGVPAAAGPALAQSLTIDNNTSVTLPSGITTESGGVVVGNTTGTNPAGAPGGQLIVPVGAQLNTPGFTIGNMAGSTGEVIVDGGKIQGIPSTGQNVIGNGGAGVLIIRNGGTVDTTVTPPGGSLTNIGIGPSSMGTLTVEGTGSTYREGGTGAPAFVAALGGGSLATINILAGGAVFSAGTIQIGGTGRATATISGQGSLALAGTSLGVGVLPTAAGSSLTVTDGGRATATTLFYMAFNAGNTASATVSNGGTISGTTLLVGFQGDADLQIQSGGTAVASGSTAIAGGGGSSTVEVSGTGANLMAQGGLLVGGGGDGTLTISGGGIVSVTGNTFIAGQCSDSGGLPVSSCSMANGGPFQGGSGSVTVTGGGSALNSSSALFVGQYGLGSLTISDSGTVLAPGGTMLGGFGGQGTINIGAPAGAAPVGPGTLVTPFVLFGGTNDLLVFNHTDTSGSYVFSPLIEGPGAVNVLAGVTTLTANNTYTGPTTVNGGALVVDGSIASSSLTTVNSGAALIGTGTVGQTVINSGGFLVPGHSPGTMTVNGSLAFQSGAFYVVQVNPATASNTNVSGTATLAGTVAAVFAPGAYTKQSYPILTAAGGLMGTRFDGLETHGLPPDFGARVNYIGNTAFLNLFAHLVPEVTPPGSTLPTVRPPPIGVVPGLPPSEQPDPPDPPAGAPLPIFTVNQLNVGHAIDNFFNNGGTLPPAFASLFNLTGSNLTTALEQLSGEPATGAQKVAFQLTNQFLDLMLDPFVDGRCGTGRTDQPPLGFAGDCETRPSALGFAPRERRSRRSMSRAGRHGPVPMQPHQRRYRHHRQP